MAFISNLSEVCKSRDADLLRCDSFLSCELLDSSPEKGIRKLYSWPAALQTHSVGSEHGLTGFWLTDQPFWSELTLWVFGCVPGGTVQHQMACGIRIHYRNAWLFLLGLSGISLDAFVELHMSADVDVVFCSKYKAWFGSLLVVYW